MARILVACWPFHGHLYPLMAIAQALRIQGHECAFFTGPRALATVREQGFPAYSFKKLQLDAHYAKLFADNAGAHVWYRIPGIAQALQESFLDTVPDQIEDLDPVLAEFRPDAIACDMLLWGPILITSARTPVAVCSVFPVCPVPGVGIPPFGLGYPLPRTFLQKLVCNAASAGAHVIRNRFQKRVNAIRKRYQLPDLTQSFHEFSATLPLYILPCSREFDYGRQDTPPSVQYVGPLLWNPGSREGANLDFLEKIPRQQPWVHATEGTLHGGQPLVLKAAAEGLRSKPVEVIMTTGEERDPVALGLTNLAPNIHVTQWVSHSELLPHLEVMITTGGAGSVLAAMSAGVPLILVPTAWDKPEIAQRVVEAGAGIRISPKHCNPRNVRAATEKIMGDPSFRRNARKLSDSFYPLGGSRRAAELIGQLAAGADQAGTTFNLFLGMA